MEARNVGEGGGGGEGPCFVSDFAGNKDASRLVGKFMLRSSREKRNARNREDVKMRGNEDHLEGDKTDTKYNL